MSGPGSWHPSSALRHVQNDVSGCRRTTLSFRCFVVPATEVVWSNKAASGRQWEGRCAEKYRSTIRRRDRNGNNRTREILIESFSDTNARCSRNNWELGGNDRLCQRLRPEITDKSATCNSQLIVTVVPTSYLNHVHLNLIGPILVSYCSGNWVL